VSALFEKLGAVEKTADISPCGKYRYSLSRRWSDAPLVAWVMLNPSTADANIDDPTIRRCMGFARDWGYGGIVVVNLFPFRETKPAKMRGVPDLFGEYYRPLPECVADAGLVVAAWGKPQWRFVAGRAAGVLADFRKAGVVLHCLGTTGDGHPWHPLYIPAITKPKPFSLIALKSAAPGEVAGG
jgi:hypothetical protein